ncbi:hypothetical protein MGN70_013611 [Eutypa lata]|nr:hypothetical protein MGN70_013611 [Eutypa lata]
MPHRATRDDSRRGGSSARLPLRMRGSSGSRFSSARTAGYWEEGEESASAYDCEDGELVHSYVEGDKDCWCHA